MDIETCDFGHTINKSKEGDFIFVDPPYTVKHNLNEFIKYNEKIFSWEDQIRLSNCIAKAVTRGASALILNTDHHSVWKLYKCVGRMFAVKRASVISGNSNARGMYTELAIKC